MLPGLPSLRVGEEVKIMMIDVLEKKSACRVQSFGTSVRSLPLENVDVRYMKTGRQHREFEIVRDAHCPHIIILPPNNVT